jgi:hypothetical protein
MEADIKVSDTPHLVWSHADCLFENTHGRAATRVLMQNHTRKMKDLEDPMAGLPKDDESEAQAPVKRDRPEKKEKERKRARSSSSSESDSSSRKQHKHKRSKGDKKDKKKSKKREKKDKKKSEKKSKKYKKEQKDRNALGHASLPAYRAPQVTPLRTYCAVHTYIGSNVKTQNGAAASRASRRRRASWWKCEARHGGGDRKTETCGQCGDGCCT